MGLLEPASALPANQEPVSSPALACSVLTLLLFKVDLRLLLLLFINFYTA
jgi:hypothetical protein